MLMPHRILDSKELCHVTASVVEIDEAKHLEIYEISSEHEPVIRLGIRVIQESTLVTPRPRILLPILE